MRTPIVALVLAAACAGDSPPATGKCTGAPYQSCNTEDDCDLLLCQNFANEFQVCSQPCDAATACPEGGVCDDVTGACKPPAPDDCTL